MNRKIFKVFLSLLLSISLIIGNSVSFADTTDENPADPYFNFTDYDDTDEDDYYFYYDDNENNNENQENQDNQDNQDNPEEQEESEEEKPIDMTNVTLASYNVTSYLYPQYYYRAKTSYSTDTVEIPINADFDLDYVYGENFSCKSSNSKIKVNAYVSDNKLHIYQTYKKKPNTGKTTLTIKIYGKEFTVKMTTKKLGISDQSYLLVKGKSKKLKVTGYNGKIVWKSSNPKIATVSKKGVVKGKKIGNVIITAKVGDSYLGCAVSVTTKKIRNVAKRATYMGTHWTYSQEKRNLSGYYDCSALVWKAYNEKAGINFGYTGWPATADYEAFWCRDHKRMVKGGITYKKIEKMTINPGDLLFKSSSMKKKYADIYHVEMFTGYFCHYVYSDGQACFSPTWAARDTNYMFEDGSLLGRPMKY
ncbi:Uncharacterized conserved protein YjdB, contains Ig-like domain [Lachnospiraceae bacterium]|nr:Uncharacterized conserved protein YjdB, contains Ig-like domain [Lachnospiraceae bacterium]